MRTLLAIASLCLCACNLQDYVAYSKGKDGTVNYIHDRHFTGPGGEDSSKRGDGSSDVYSGTQSARDIANAVLQGVTGVAATHASVKINGQNTNKDIANTANTRAPTVISTTNPDGTVVQQVVQPAAPALPKSFSGGH